MSYYDLNKHCLEVIEARLKLTDARIKNDSVALKLPEKLELTPKPSDAYSRASDIVLNEKRICLDKVKEALYVSSLSPESQTSIYNKIKRIVEPTNTNDVGKNVEKFIANQPKLTDNPEQNKASIENWAKQLSVPVKEHEKQVAQSEADKQREIAPPITEKFNDKADKPPPKKKIDRERDI
jgi:hypothetical protein